MNKGYLAVGVIFISGITLGAGGGYYLAKKRLDRWYDAALTEENLKTRDFYERRYKAGDFSNPIDAAEATGAVDEAADALRKYEYRGPTANDIVSSLRESGVPAEDIAGVESTMITEEGVESVQDVIERNIFETDGDSVVLDIERRTPNRPYVITEEEFAVNEPGHSQISLTYYAGDNVLADDEDSVVEHVDEIVGSWNLIYFGVGSGDPNIVFVRHEKLDADYEISQRQDKYKVVVLSFNDDDLQHSDEPMPRKKRLRDD